MYRNAAVAVREGSELPVAMFFRGGLGDFCEAKITGANAEPVAARPEEQQRVTPK